MFFTRPENLSVLITVQLGMSDLFCMLLVTVVTIFAGCLQEQAFKKTSKIRLREKDVFCRARHFKKNEPPVRSQDVNIFSLLLTSNAEPTAWEPNISAHGLQNVSPAFIRLEKTNAIPTKAEPGSHCVKVLKQENAEMRFWFQRLNLTRIPESDLKGFFRYLRPQI